MTQSCNADYFAHAKLLMEADKCGTLTTEKFTEADSAAIGSYPEFCKAKLISIALSCQTHARLIPPPLGVVGGGLKDPHLSAH